MIFPSIRDTRECLPKADRYGQAGDAAANHDNANRFMFTPSAL